MPEMVQPESRGRVKFVIFGCGSIGFAVLQELAGAGEQVLVIDHDPDRVRELRDQHFEASVKEMTDPELMAGLPPFEIGFLVTGDHEANLAALRTIKGKNPAIEIMARATDPLNAERLEQAGADYVLSPSPVVARAAIHQITKLHANRVSMRLYDLLSGWDGVLGIITHKNPDPDAISSAMALAAIAKSANPKKLAIRIFYDGVIGHQENRTMVNLLEIKMEKYEPQVLQECNYLALVDCPGPGVNNPLSPRTRVHIVIDHHQDGQGLEAAVPFVDIRPGLGATASILAQYMQELDIGIDRLIATGLLYGIRSDTRDFERNVTPSDLTNAAFLLPLADNDLLDQIKSPSLSMETLDVLGVAIRNRKIRSGYLFSNVGYVRNRDALPQAADLLITLEGVNCALVYGISDDAIIMSARNRDIRLHIGNVLSEAFGDIGDAGGHPNMAAATIPLEYFRRVKNKDDLLNLIIDPLLKKFNHLAGLENEGKDEL
jgi:nanoRNase/pAp phosphatase (c-di-AMP/oligoRNAs hydrolase)